MPRLRKICVLTGTRAEYGLLYWLLKEIAADPDLELSIVATGTHLAPEFGLTYQQIESDGFVIDARVEMLLSSDTAVGIGKSMGLGTIGFAEAFDRLQPDLLVLLGDRFEILAAAGAALIARIPIAHIHGGETTEGAVDEGIRHAVTKMAHWHFVAAQAYRKRVIQMGEPPDRVFDFGAPGLEQIRRMEWTDRNELEAYTGLTFSPMLFLVTYHPETLSETEPLEDFEALLSALGDFPKARVVFTYPNADARGRELISRLDSWVASEPQRSRAFDSLGQQRYLSLMREADVVVGNSSSGLIEAPAVKTSTVNIGDRQRGRLRATSVIDARPNRHAIAQAIKQAVSDGFRSQLATTESLYGDGDHSRQVKDVLKAVELRTRKSFFDIEHDH